MLVHAEQQDAALDNLERCVLLSDPTLDLDYPGFRALKTLPRFKQLGKLAPTYPSVLQALAVHLALNIPAVAAGLLHATSSGYTPSRKR